MTPLQSRPVHTTDQTEFQRGRSGLLTAGSFFGLFLLKGGIFAVLYIYK